MVPFVMVSYWFYLGFGNLVLVFLNPKWDFNLVVKKLISILEVQGLIPTNDMGCGQQWDFAQIFLTYLANLYYMFNM
jgi:hypothetical protein